MALVLTRKQGEKIHIGEDIIVRIDKVQRNGAVRIAIEAPKEVRVLRGELLEPDNHKEER